LNWLISHRINGQTLPLMKIPAEAQINPEAAEQVYQFDNIIF
jgi:hypothetical protein